MKIFKKCRIFGCTAPLHSFQLQQSIKNLAVDLDVFSQLLTSPVFFLIARHIRTEKRRIIQQDKNTDGENLGNSYENGDGGKSGKSSL
jgi:hypothetical protein